MLATLGDMLGRLQDRRIERDNACGVCCLTCRHGYDSWPHQGLRIDVDPGEIKLTCRRFPPALLPVVGGKLDVAENPCNFGQPTVRGDDVCSCWRSKP